MRKSLTVIVTSLALTASAQVRWLETERDFGAFSEDLGQVTTHFRFVNEGTEPVYITDARATCGCTDPTYSDAAVQPGDTAVVHVAYLASGRPGRFTKKVYVTTSGIPAVQTSLTVKGVVVGASATLKSRYPVEAGPMKLRNDNVSFGEVKQGRLRSVYLEGYNATQDTVTFVVNAPDYIKVIAVPDTVPPGEQTTIQFTLNSTNLPFGIGSATGCFYPDDGVTAVPIEFFYIIAEDFDRLTPGERLNAPVIEFNTTKQDLGILPADDNRLRTLTFEVKNTGKRTLDIHRVQTTDPAIQSAQMSSNSIKKGKTATLTVKMDPSKSETDIINSRIMLICNDPDNSTPVVRVTAELTR